MVYYKQTKENKTMIPSAVIFGAGNIGRGFIGQLFSESGFQVTFVDVAEELIVALNQRGAYTVELVDNQRHERHEVGPVRALHSQRDAQEAARALSEAELAATAVGARILPHIAPLVAEGIRQRMRKAEARPLNLIICENLKDAARQFRAMVGEHLSEEENAWAAEHVGFVDTVIGRMVPPPTEEYRLRDPSRILVEPYRELPVDRAGIRGGMPAVSGMEICDNFPVYTARKLYIHNCGHAVLAYLGYLRGYEYGYEALADPAVFAAVKQALQESREAIVREYDADSAWLEAHILDLLGRFTNTALGDTIFRLGRDPIRKLAPQDRLIGPLRLAEAHGVAAPVLTRAVAAAYRFDPLEDPIAQELQQAIRGEGFEKVLERVSGIGPAEPLGVATAAAYRALAGEQTE